MPRCKVVMSVWNKHFSLVSIIDSTFKYVNFLKMRFLLSFCKGAESISLRAGKLIMPNRLLLPLCRKIYAAVYCTLR